MIYAIITILLAVNLFLFFYRQKKLKHACQHILDAIDNKDYTYRISTRGLYLGDKAIVETLNSLIKKISEERQDIEVQSWERLTRILTHEIMNGIAPITSLSSVFMRRKEVQESPIYDGIKAIHDTSTGLMDFVDSYRKFTSLQQPSPEFFSLRELLEGVKNLGLVDSEVKIYTKYDLDSDQVYADKNLIRQVVINIVKNAGESFKDITHTNERTIQIFAYQYNGTPFRIAISNNGAPIPDDVRHDIFVPFFSTKKTGSGIGLALCRQIMRLSGGTINLLRANINGWPTTFVLELPFVKK